MLVATLGEHYELPVGVAEEERCVKIQLSLVDEICEHEEDIDNDMVRYILGMAGFDETQITVALEKIKVKHADVKHIMRNLKLHGGCLKKVASDLIEKLQLCDDGMPNKKNNSTSELHKVTSKHISFRCAWSHC